MPRRRGAAARGRGRGGPRAPEPVVEGGGDSNDDASLREALRMSLMESQQRDDIELREEEDMRRAIAESLKNSTSSQEDVNDESQNTTATSEGVDDGSRNSTSASEETHDESQNTNQEDLDDNSNTEDESFHTPEASINDGNGSVQVHKIDKLLKFHPRINFVCIHRRLFLMIPFPWVQWKRWPLRRPRTIQ